MDYIESKIEHAKRMLDEIDAMIDSDGSMLFDAGIIRAREMYMRDFVRLSKLEQPKQADQPKRRLDGLRSNVTSIKRTG